MCATAAGALAAGGRGGAGGGVAAGWWALGRPGGLAPVSAAMLTARAFAALMLVQTWFNASLAGHLSEYKIRIDPGATEEERYAAQQLQIWSGAIAGSVIPIIESTDIQTQNNY